MTKVAILDKDGRVCTTVVSYTGPEHRRLANKVMDEALQKCNLRFEDLAYVVGTGYGRMNIPFADRQITEMSCHARGVASMFPNVRLAIDIGGQDSKALKIKEGRLLDFVMNDKCAAGTGRFLEVVAGTLGLKLEDLGSISLGSAKAVSISSTCTVFAQQEVIARLSDGAAIEDVVAGLHDSIASRAGRMARRLRVEPDVVFTGGVAKNTGVVRALARNLGCQVLVPQEPLMSGALGAALFGRDLVLKALTNNEAIARAERKLGETTFYGE